LEHPGVSELYKTNMIAPSKQHFTTRGGKLTQNKWRASHCHCGACRHTVGALMVDWVNIPSKDIIIIRKGATRKYRSSTHASREFVSIAYPHQYPYSDLVVSSVKHAGRLSSFGTTTTRKLSM
jgi:hypothetical protein